MTITVLAIIPSENENYSSILNEWVEKLKPENMGKELKYKADNNNDIIIAYINNEPIYKNEFEFKKYLKELSFYNNQINNISTDDSINSDEDIIKEIAIHKLIYKKAEELGIEFTREEAIKKLRESHEKLEQLAKADFQDYQKKLEEEKQFLEAMDLTIDEYIQTIGSDLEIEYQTLAKYVSCYYKEEQHKKELDPNYQIKNYLEHFDGLLEQAGFRCHGIIKL